MKNRDFLPYKDNDLLAWCTNFLAILASILPRIEFPAEVHAALTALLNTFKTKLGIAEAPATRTKTAVKDKNLARKALKKETRQAVKEHLNFNHRVTEIDRENLGLPIYKTTRDAAPVATTFPWVQVIINLIRHLHFDFGGEETSKAKPEGQHGMELAGQIGGEKPANARALKLSYFDTHTPLVIEFEEEDRGKTFWYAV
ncbi:MAG: hypothetical protein LBG31_04420, partial [Prevotellaceae bacterium]|nr:hypothetical protein [Prevotellaceae bacterium]